MVVCKLNVLLEYVPYNYVVQQTTLKPVLWILFLICLFFVVFFYRDNCLCDALSLSSYNFTCTLFLHIFLFFPCLFHFFFFYYICSVFLFTVISDCRIPS